jgi:hypothetical protein
MRCSAGCSLISLFDPLARSRRLIANGRFPNNVDRSSAISVGVTRLRVEGGVGPTSVGPETETPKWFLARLKSGLPGRLPRLGHGNRPTASLLQSSVICHPRGAPCPRRVDRRSRATRVPSVTATRLAPTARTRRMAGIRYNASAAWHARTSTSGRERPGWSESPSSSLHGPGISTRSVVVRSTSRLRSGATARGVPSRTESETSIPVRASRCRIDLPPAPMTSSSRSHQTQQATVQEP